MQRTIRRLVFGVLAGLVLTALVAATASAATVTTQPASNLTATTAVLHGVVDTGGAATAWQFQFGKTKSYGKGTPLQQVAAGKGTVAVSWRVTGLAPNTTYHFRLVATTGAGTYYYPANVTFGSDFTFRTNRTGRLLIVRTHLVVTNGSVSVPLRCRSGLSCKGRFTIGTRAKLAHSNKPVTVRCATGSFNIGSHKTKTVKVRVTRGCLALLSTSPNQTHTAKITSNPRTGQHALIKKVRLTLG